MVSRTPTTTPSLFRAPHPTPPSTGLGVRVIVVVGAQQQIDSMLTERGMTPKYVGGYRLTDQKAMRIAIEAAGQIRTTCEQFLSKVGREGGGYMGRRARVKRKEPCEGEEGKE